MRIKNKRIILLFISLFSLAAAKAQLGLGYLSTKGISGFGFEGIFSFSGYVTRSDVVTLEADFGYYRHIGFYPLLILGYRHTFNGKGHGWYIEPQFCYSIGTANIPRSDSAEFPSRYVNGSIIQPKVNGPGAGAAVGYLFPGWLGYNVGLRYEHIFVAGDPAINMLVLRFSLAIAVGKTGSR